MPLAPTGTHAEEAQLSLHCNIWQKLSRGDNIRINTLGTKQIGKKHVGVQPYSSAKEDFGCNTKQAPKSKTYGMHSLKSQVATPAAAEPGEGSHQSQVDLIVVL